MSWVSRANPRRRTPLPAPPGEPCGRCASPAGVATEVRERAGLRQLPYNASWSSSPVRMRITCSSGLTKILPSPILPVRAEFWIASSTRSSCSSATAASSLILGRKSTTYSAPRYSSVWPFWRPKPFTSVTVMPCTPTSASASRTSSSLNGLMIATTSFMECPRQGRRRRRGRPFCLHGCALSRGGYHVGKFLHQITESADGASTLCSRILFPDKFEASSMMDRLDIDQLARRLASLVPPGVAQAQQDLRTNFHDVLAQGLRRLDLVTREEFDVQSQVLARTRAKVEELERRVAELEATAAARGD